MSDRAHPDFTIVVSADNARTPFQRTWDVMTILTKNAAIMAVVISTAGGALSTLFMRPEERRTRELRR